MSNSSLVSYTKISPNKTSPRNHAIDTITIHCMAGQLSVEQCGNVFAPSSRQASSNYGVGTDGRIALYVDEKDRSWCSSNSANDNRAVTIEVASDSKHPYAVNDKAYNATIQLVADICRRNGIKQLIWSTDKATRVNHLNGANMTVHRDFAAKACPGEYLYNRMGAIASAVNNILSASASSNIYRVRKSANDASSQLGAFTNLDKAKALADKNAGYEVYDTQGNQVYPVNNVAPASVQTISNNYYPKYTGRSGSITAALSAVGEKDTSLSHRRKIAIANSIASYSGTAAQNTKMVNLLKQGKLVRA